MAGFARAFPPAERARGFTLVEVLAALAVLAIAFAAVMRGLAQGIDLAAELREREVALWVAQNRLAGHEAERAFPTPDTRDGETEMGGRSWRWREQVAATPDADLRRIEIEVRADPQREALARLAGFLRRPAGPP
jgi:general secretion pathway protein I